MVAVRVTLAVPSLIEDADRASFVVVGVPDDPLHPVTRLYALTVPIPVAKSHPVCVP